MSKQLINCYLKKEDISFEELSLGLAADNDILTSELLRSFAVDRGDIKMLIDLCCIVDNDDKQRQYYSTFILPLVKDTLLNSIKVCPKHAIKVMKLMLIDFYKESSPSERMFDLDSQEVWVKELSLITLANSL